MTFHANCLPRRQFAWNIIFSGKKNEKIINLPSAEFVHSMLSVDFYTSFFQVWTIAVAYFIALLFFWNEGSRQTLQYVSVPVWLMIILHVAAAAGPLRVPLLLLMVVAVTVGFIAEKKEAIRRQEGIGGCTMNTGFWHLLFGFPAFYSHLHFVPSVKCQTLVQWDSFTMYQACKLHYCLWRVSKKPKLPFSDLWCVLCFQRQSFWHLL